MPDVSRSNPLRALALFIAAFHVLVLLMAVCAFLESASAEVPQPGTLERRSPVLPNEVLFAQVVSADLSTLSAAEHGDIADAYLALGSEEAALAHLSVAAQETDDPTLWRELADAYRVRGDWSAARQALEGVLRSLPSDPAAHFQLGVLLAPHNLHQAYDHLAFAADDPVLGTSARRLQAAIAEAQLDSPAYQSAQIGVALAALEHWAQAEQAFDMAVALDSGYPEAWAYLGLARARQGKDAVPAFEQALAQASDEPLVWYLYGLMWRAVGDYAQSQQALGEAQRLAPDNPAFAAELGTAYRLLGDLSTAEYWLRTATALAPAEDDFLTLLALFYADELYDLEGNGLTTLQEAVDAQPDNADLQAAYAWALFNLREIAAAEEAINTALMLEPDNPRALYYRGLMYQNQALPDLAVETLARLLDHPAPEGFDVLARRTLESMGYRPS